MNSVGSRVARSQLNIAGRGGRTERFAEIAAEIARLKVDVIVTAGAAPVFAVKQATSLIPIVFAIATDPVGTGIVASLARPGGSATALYVCADPLVNANRIHIVTLALSARLPTIFGERENVDEGGLMSYGPNVPGMFRRAAELVDKILRGAKPGDIPVEQPTRFEFILNLKTARALGLEISPILLARADEVIE
jgi:putative ABC transport system substrate-binding protein